jgi:hypothetical protein
MKCLRSGMLTITRRALVGVRGASAACARLAVTMITIIASPAAVFPVRSVVISSFRVASGKSNRIASC